MAEETKFYTIYREGGGKPIHVSEKVLAYDVASGEGQYRAAPTQQAEAVARQGGASYTSGIKEEMQANFQPSQKNVRQNVQPPGYDTEAAMRVNMRSRQLMGVDLYDAAAMGNLPESARPTYEKIAAEEGVKPFYGTKPGVAVQEKTFGGAVEGAYPVSRVPSFATPISQAVEERPIGWSVRQAPTVTIQRTDPFTTGRGGVASATGIPEKIQGTISAKVPAFALPQDVVAARKQAISEGYPEGSIKLTEQTEKVFTLPSSEVSTGKTYGFGFTTQKTYSLSATKEIQSQPKEEIPAGTPESVYGRQTGWISTAEREVGKRLGSLMEIVTVSASPLTAPLVTERGIRSLPVTYAEAGKRFVFGGEPQTSAGKLFGGLAASPIGVLRTSQTPLIGTERLNILLSADVNREAQLQYTKQRAKEESFAGGVETFETGLMAAGLEIGIGKALKLPARQPTMKVGNLYVGAYDSIAGGAELAPKYTVTEEARASPITKRGLTFGSETEKGILSVENKIAPSIFPEQVVESRTAFKSKELPSGKYPTVVTDEGKPREILSGSALKYKGETKTFLPVGEEGFPQGGKIEFGNKPRIYTEKRYGGQQVKLLGKGGWEYVAGEPKQAYPIFTIEKGVTTKAKFYPKDITTIDRSLPIPAVGKTEIKGGVTKTYFSIPDYSELRLYGEKSRQVKISKAGKQVVGIESSTRSTSEPSSKITGEIIGKRGKINFVGVVRGEPGMGLPESFGKEELIPKRAFVKGKARPMKPFDIEETPITKTSQKAEPTIGGKKAPRATGGQNLIEIEGTKFKSTELSFAEAGQIQVPKPKLNIPVGMFAQMVGISGKTAQGAKPVPSTTYKTKEISFPKPGIFQGMEQVFVIKTDERPEVSFGGGVTPPPPTIPDTGTPDIPPTGGKGGFGGLIFPPIFGGGTSGYGRGLGKRGAMPERLPSLLETTFALSKTKFPKFP
jgi:hypothetical protein